MPVLSPWHALYHGRRPKQTVACGVAAGILEKQGKEEFMAGERLVVVGGDAAGMSAASQARRRSPDLEIVVFERTPFTSYSN
jgi:succinate dehydrogenase/fumarate reductase flavoprotein subunit